MFDRVHLSNVDFSEADLTNYQFLNCTFEVPCWFQDAVLNGVVFENCEFCLVEEPTGDGVLRGYGIPLMAYGVQFHSPRRLGASLMPKRGAVAPTPAPPPPPAPAAPRAPAPTPDYDSISFKSISFEPAPDVRPRPSAPVGIVRFPSRVLRDE